MKVYEGKLLRNVMREISEEKRSVGNSGRKYISN